jgi:uncharacterized protein YkwD
MSPRGVLLVVALLMATTAPTSAATTIVTDPAQRVMGYVNDARAARGLVPLRADGRLWGLAGDRARRLAASGVLSHQAAGSLPEDLRSRGIQWYSYSEDIGYVSGTPGVAARKIFRMWAASPTHWDLLMSPASNYVGVGLVYDGRSRMTFGSVVLTESNDRTGARATILGSTISGDDIRWSWRGWDPQLQTHTAGLRDLSVQLRVDGGAWVTIASRTRGTARSTLDNVPGHRYGLRVQATDRAGNVGPWSREFRVWLP